METTFENAQKGDRAYCSLYGGICNTNLEIIKVTDNSITIKADVGNYEDIFFCNGTYRNNGNQILFWSKPEFEVPVRPKKMVKKTVYMGYNPKVVTSKDTEGKGKRWHPSTALYYEESDALEAFSSYKVIPIEIEAEE